VESFDLWYQLELAKLNLLLELWPMTALLFVIFMAMIYAASRYETKEQRQQRLSDQVDRDIDAHVAKYPHEAYLFGKRDKNGKWRK
jgi:hypothetical protein